jgi:hypothetical protein
LEPVNLVTGESTADVTSLLVYFDHLAGLEAWVKRDMTHGAEAVVGKVGEEEAEFRGILRGHSGEAGAADILSTLLAWGNGHAGHAPGGKEGVLGYVDRRRMRLGIFVCLLACLFVAILR